MITLGKKVKDRITGFVGIATARAVYLNKCVRIQITPTMKSDGKSPEPDWFDEDDIKEIGLGVTAKPKSPPGGPHKHEPTISNPK